MADNLVWSMDSRTTCLWGMKFCKLFGMTRVRESDHSSTLFEVSLLPPRFRITSKPTKILYDYYSRKYEEVKDFLDMERGMN